MRRSNQERLTTLNLSLKQRRNEARRPGKGSASFFSRWTFGLPAALGQAGNLSLVTELAERDSGKPELPVVGAGPTGDRTAVSDTGLI